MKSPHLRPRAELRVAMLIENIHQDLEVWYPVFRFQEAGARVVVVGPSVGRYTSKLGYPIEAEVDAASACSQDFDVVIVPGGYAPDLMRLCRPMVNLVREAYEGGAVVAAICHGSWLLASAGIIRGRRVTGAPSIADDLINAGATFVDEPAVTDGRIVTSRKPSDIPQFSAALFAAVEARRLDAAVA